MKYRLLVILISMAAFIGCQEIVDVELEEGPSRLVVEGRIEKYKDNGYQVIKLSTTDDYFSNSDNPPATGAFVERGARRRAAAAAIVQGRTRSGRADLVS